MVNQYDFLNLSYSEFEELVKDLLSIEWGVRLESFAEGRDRGIDLRLNDPDNGITIVQCKRYNKFLNLYAALKNEAVKIELLNPQQYYVVTSVDLTVVQKEKVYAIFSKWMASEANILGQRELNALLRKYPQAERNHFKLWLHSTHVLDAVVKSKVINQSRFELQQIKDLLKVYVANDSFGAASEILSTNRYVIISGIPGIGKTTLARILSYYYLAHKGYEEFVYISESIDEAFELLKEGVKQVFLYDDFLGQSIEELRLGRNEDRRLVAFIELVKASKDKILIFTTREYILKDTQLRYELLDSPAINLSKCILGLRHYTLQIKARILHNHLCFSNLSEEYVREFGKPEIYQQIIYHKNYSPRLLSLYLHTPPQKNTTPREFAQELLNMLEHPAGLWELPFQRHIKPFSRFLLLVFLTLGNSIYLQELSEAMQAFCKLHEEKYKLHFSQRAFKDAIKELEGSFIRTYVHYGWIRVRLQNGGVQDFLLDHFRYETEYLADIIKAAVFFNQLFFVFRTTTNKAVYGEAQRIIYPIVCTRELDLIRVQRLEKDFDNLRTSWHPGYPLLFQLDKLDEDTLINFYRLNTINNEFTAEHQLSRVVEELLFERFPTCEPFTIMQQVKYRTAYMNLVARLNYRLKLDGTDFVNDYFLAIDNLGDVIWNYWIVHRTFSREVQIFVSKDQYFRQRICSYIQIEVYLLQFRSFHAFLRILKHWNYIAPFPNLDWEKLIEAYNKKQREAGYSKIDEIEDVHHLDNEQSMFEPEDISHLFQSLRQFERM